MNSKVATLRKCGNVQRICLSDAQYAGELAFSDTVAELGWKPPRMAKEFGVSLNTVKNWCAEDITPNPYVIHTCPEFAQVWERHFARHLAEISAKRAA